MPKRPRRKYIKRRRYRKGVKRTRKSFKKAVQRVIDKNVETKHAFTTLDPTQFNSGISGGGDIRQVLPNITTGTADNARIGDQIRLKSMTIKGSVIWNPVVNNFGTYASARLYVRMFIVAPKYYSTTAAVQNNTGWLDLLLKKGGTTSGFTGVMSDLWAPVNTDAVTKYYDKVVRLEGIYGNNTSNLILSGGDKFFSKTFRFRGAGKLLKYDSAVSSGLQPTNFAPVFLLGYVYANNSSPTTLTTDVACQWDCNFNYQDA